MVLTPAALCPQLLPHCSRHILSPRPTRMQRGNSKHGPKNTLQMLLLGFFISCFKQLCFGLSPRQALSAGIAARCTGTICSAPCLAAQEVGAGQFGKANAHMKASQPCGSTARAPASIWPRSKAPLAAGRGVSWWLPAATASPGARGQRGRSCSGEGGGDGGAAPLQLERGVANSNWGGQAQLWERSLSQSWPVWGHRCCDQNQRAVGAGCGRCWAAPGSPAGGKGWEVPTAWLSTAAASSRR